MEFPTISLFPIHSKPFGEDYGEWSARWWQWLLSIPLQDSPAFDFTGTNANNGQTDPNVFYLCQTIESNHDVVRRKCTIASGKSIFMPIINWISILNIEGDTEQEMVSIAREKIDAVEYMEVEVDEFKITEDPRKYRATSPFFNITLPKNNVIDRFHTVESGVRLKAVSEGYWLFLKPLTRVGEHRIRTAARSTVGPLRIEVDYQVDII